MDLNGKRILITRPKGQSESFARRLKDLGAIPIFFPVIEIAPVQENSALDQVLRALDEYDWLVLTSGTGLIFGFLVDSPADFRGRLERTKRCEFTALLAPRDRAGPHGCGAAWQSGSARAPRMDTSTRSLRRSERTWTGRTHEPSPRSAERTAGSPAHARDQEIERCSPAAHCCSVPATCAWRASASSSPAFETA